MFKYTLWFVEFCTAFYTTYSSIGSDDVDTLGITTTASTATAAVGLPNGYVETNDIENFKASTMYVESLSDEELAKFKQNIDLEDFTYQDDSTNDIDLGNSKTM